MRGILLGLVVALPLIWVGVVWFLVRRGLNLPSLSLSLSDILNVALFVLTVVSIVISLSGLSIATASYQQAVDAAKKQLQAGEEQSKILEAQAETLNAARRALEEQVAIAREERAEYLARLARRPRVEIDVDAAGHEARITGDGKTLTIELQPGRPAFDLVVVLRNTGDAILQKPLVMFGGNNRVTFEPRQFAGLNLQDLLPFSQIKKGYRFNGRVIIPNEVDAFEMLVDVSGDNMSSDATALNVKVLRKPIAPPPE